MCVCIDESPPSLTPPLTLERRPGSNGARRGSEALQRGQLPLGHQIRQKVNHTTFDTRSCSTLGQTREGQRCRRTRVRLVNTTSFDVWNTTASICFYHSRTTCESSSSSFDDLKARREGQTTRVYTGASSTREASQGVQSDAVLRDFGYRERLHRQ